MSPLLNSEEIAARRIPLSDTEVVFGKNTNWHCHYCNKRMVNESTFMKHVCPVKKKTEELKSPLGQAAFSYYNEWLKQKRFSQQKPETFLDSREFRPFMKFAQMVIDTNMAKPEKYIELMIAGNIQPALWRQQSAYSIYLKSYDSLTEPMEDVQASLNYLFDICESEKILKEDGTPDISKVLKHIGPQRIINFVRQKRLSPWLLFCAPSFREILTKLDSSEKSTLDTLINGTYWADKFKSNKSTVNDIVELTKEIGL